MDEELLDDPLEIGRRIGAACGYSAKKQTEIAAELGRDPRTLRSYIDGNLGDYSTPELRRSLIERIEEITGCPPEIFGLKQEEPELDEVSGLLGLPKWLREYLLKMEANAGAGISRVSQEVAEEKLNRADLQRRVEQLERTAEAFRR